MKRFFLLFFLTSFYFKLTAQWNTNTSVNTPISVNTNSQKEIHAVSDTKGGAILVWEDSRNTLTNSTDIYVQRIDSNGYTKWATNGVVICANAALQQSASIVEDGNGGAIITWEDFRAGNFDIYAQHIDSMGNSLWTANGLVICNKINTAQKSPKIIGDNSGGAIIVWEDSLNLYFDVYAQKINANGTVAWSANGVAACTAVNTQINPKIDTDGAGGAIITWQDRRNNVDYDVYAQRLNSNGIAQWTANGVVICSTTSTQSNPRIEPDGLGGAIIGWVDKRNGIDNNIYAQRINSSGTVQWTANGINICNAAANQSALDIKYAGANGVFFTWKDQRNGSYDIYAQLLDLSGLVQLPTNGIKLSSSLKSINPNNVADDAGGVITVWQDSTISGWNIMAQKLNSTGTTQWATNGAIVSNATDDQINATNVSDGTGGAVFVWEDHRNTLDYDIYAGNLYTNGTTTGITETLNEVEVITYPNPAKDFISFSINNKTNSAKIITLFNSIGKTIKKIETTENSIAISLSEYESGIYFYTIKLTNNLYSKGNFVLSK
jgi:hypothetical protein